MQQRRVVIVVDRVLLYLMQRGIRMEGGDKLGKRIVFARSQKHTDYIRAGPYLYWGQECYFLHRCMNLRL